MDCVEIKGLQKTLYLGNLEAKRDWGHAITLLQCGKFSEEPDDFVIATGIQLTVKEFVNPDLKELKIDYLWKGKGLSIEDVY